jgi:hypothetical protein
MLASTPVQNHVRVRHDASPLYWALFTCLSLLGRYTWMSCAAPHAIEKYV